MKDPKKKKRYHSPSLVRYGDFKKLTAGSKANKNEDAKASTTKTRPTTG